MARSMQWARKIGEGILEGQNKKKEIKTGKNFCIVEN
jgi:hypothetical protein